MLENESNILTIIDSLYKDRIGLAYARVSDLKQEREGHGRESQENRCKNELRALGVPYQMTFPDTYTGGGDFMNRPAMREMLAYIDAHPHQKFVVIFDDLKRFARDVEFHLKLRAAFQKRGVVLRCLNYNFDDTAEGRFVELILAGQAELERHQNKRQVVQKMKARMEMGYWPFARKKGYDIVKDPLHGKIPVPNKEGLKILKPALEMFARGELLRKIDVARYLLEHGFWKGKYADKYLDAVSDMLADCFYMGDIEYVPWAVTRRKGRHEGIISSAVFENIQKRLNKGSSTTRTRKDIRADLPVRGLVKCICGGHITAAWSKGRSGRHAYYWCINRKCDLYKKNIVAESIESGFYALLKQAKVKQEVGKVIDVVFERVWKQETANLEQQEKVIIREVKDLHERIREVTDLARKAPTPNLKAVYE